jgi:hypothetical protein
MFLSSAVRVAFAICGLLFSIALASRAAPQVRSLYFGLGAGWTGTDTAEFAAPFGRTTDGNITFSDSGAVVLSGGDRFDPPTHLDGEVHHTHAAGKLAGRRASSENTQLVADGHLEGNISTIGNGLTVPLVATGPGIRERQSRRSMLDPGE